MLVAMVSTYTCGYIYQCINNCAHIHTGIKLMYSSIIAIIQPLLYELFTGCNLHVTTWYTNHIDWDKSWSLIASSKL